MRLVVAPLRTSGAAPGIRALPFAPGESYLGEVLARPKPCDHTITASSVRTHHALMPVKSPAASKSPPASERSSHGIAFQGP